MDDSTANDEEKASMPPHKLAEAAPRGKARVHTLKEPICLQMCDTSYHCAPAHLHNLFAHFELDNMTNGEILFQLVYLIGLESGLAECSSYERCAPQLHRDKYVLPAYFDASNAFCLSQQKPKYSSEPAGTVFSMLLRSTAVDDESAQTFYEEKLLIFKLTGIVSGDAMIITTTPLLHGLPLVGHPSQSIYLSILRYIVGVPRRKEHPLQQHLNKMQELSYQLRQQIFLPVQQYFLPLFGIDRFPSLTALPTEVYDAIFHCLSRNQLRILANVNRRLNRLVMESKHYGRGTHIEQRRRGFL